MPDTAGHWTRGPVLALFLLFSACHGARDAPRTARRITVDTVPVTEVRGTAEDGSVQLGLAANATRLADGTLAIGDSADFVIRIFSRSGQPVRTFGRHGSGPGEFGAITMLAQCEPGRLYLFDNDNARLTVFDIAGRSLRSTPVRPGAAMMTCSSNDLFLALGATLSNFFPTQASAGRMYQFPLDLVHGTDTTRLYDSLPGYDPRPGGRMLALAVAGNRAYLGLMDSAWVTAFDTTGQKLTSFRISDDPLASTQAYYEHAVRAFFARYPEATGFSQFIPRLLALPRPPVMRAWHALFGAPDGTLWVQLSSPEDSTLHLHAFDTSGQRLGDLSLPFHLRILEIGTNYLVGVRENTQGEQRVVVYRIVR